MRPKLRIVCLILSLLVLVCSGPGLACPPECPECQVPDGQGGCVSNEALWDPGTGISGPVYVSDWVLCGYTGHSATNVSDTDHVYYPYTYQENWHSDGLTYAWSQSAGTNPELGTWIYGTDQAAACWQAPPCIGTVNIKVVIDDVPWPRGLCGTGTRDDGPFPYEEAANVTLPTGCEECSEAPEVSLEATGIEDTACWDCAFCGCGAMDSPRAINPNVYVCYDTCVWKFGVAAAAEIHFGPCLTFNSTPNYTEIDSGSDSDLTADNYCAIADDFDYDPAEIETGEGCAYVGDEYYSCTDCLWNHEGQHASDFLGKLEEEESELQNDSVFDDVAIDCTDLYTRTCQTALSQRKTDIEAAVDEAYNTAYVNVEEQSARETAYECFHDLAAAICSYAQGQGWPPCDHCH